jgi:diacylglycerol kinase (ATP)
MSEGLKFRKDFCNYFSFGIDAKVGYSFDKHRTGSRICNLLTYGVIGLFKSLTKTKNL